MSGSLLARFSGAGWWPGGYVRENRRFASESFDSFFPAVEFPDLIRSVLRALRPAERVCEVCREFGSWQDKEKSTRAVPEFLLEEFRRNDHKELPNEVRAFPVLLSPRRGRKEYELKASSL